MSDLTIKFGNDDARQHFVDWLIGSGEDSYQIWMDAREYEGRHDAVPDCTGPITVLRFITNKKDPSIIKSKNARPCTIKSSRFAVFLPSIWVADTEPN